LCHQALDESKKEGMREKEREGEKSKWRIVRERKREKVFFIDIGYGRTELSMSYML
jgi:hypothetical protein